MFHPDGVQNDVIYEQEHKVHNKEKWIHRNLVYVKNCPDVFMQYLDFAKEQDVQLPKLPQCEGLPQESTQERA